jgi:hypothetical protein
MGVLRSHPVPPARLEGGMLTHNRRERHAGIIPQEEPFFPPPDWRVG